MSEPSCEHVFETTVAITYIEDRDSWMADIKIRCQNCALPFMFKGVPAGLSYLGPRVSLDACELCAPIKPYDNTLAARAEFSMAREDS